MSVPLATNHLQRKSYHFIIAINKINLLKINQKWKLSTYNTLTHEFIKIINYVTITFQRIFMNCFYDLLWCTISQKITLQYITFQINCTVLSGRLVGHISFPLILGLLRHFVILLYCTIKSIHKNCTNWKKLQLKMY